MLIDTSEDTPKLAISEDARGLVVFFQEHEGPAGPIASRTEKWVRAESTLEASTLTRELIGLGAFVVDPDLDSLILATARRQGAHVFEHVRKALDRNGVLAAEIFPDGSGQIRVSTMLEGEWARVADALEDILFSTRVRSTLQGILPDELEHALKVMSAKVQIATANELGHRR